jgi:hypothetical protein
MRANAAELFIFTLIALVAIVNVALYGGFIDATDPVEGGSVADRERREQRAEAARAAEEDDDPELPGKFVETQGRQHTPPYPLGAEDQVPFCEEGEVSDDCYASNPPTSGLHLPVARNVFIGDVTLNLPPDPNIYDIEIPREAIPHILEHAGVFVGYRCSTPACEGMVDKLRTAVRLQLDAGRRVVMAPDSDLELDTIALVSWTRIDKFLADDFGEGRVRAFIEAHSCRFDPEGVCATDGGT